VPLLIAGKNIKHKVVNDQVRLADVLPTVLSLCNIKKELNFSGVDLTGRIKGEKKTAENLPVFATGTLYGPEKYCLIKDGYKIIENTQDMTEKSNLIGYACSLPIEFYNIRGDYYETNNILKTSKKRIAMHGELNKFKVLKSTFKQDSSVVVVDQETRKKLEALGYIK